MTAAPAARRRSSTKASTRPVTQVLLELAYQLHSTRAVPAPRPAAGR